MKDYWLIKNGRIIDPVTGRDEIGDLFISDGKIAPLPDNPPLDVQEVDATGFVVVPGLIDLHVHFREPGDEQAETIESGSKAAARGGFTTVVAMPNTSPVIDNAEMVQLVRRRSKAAGLVRVLPSGCITKNRCGLELADLAGMAKAGAVAFTDDGLTVRGEKLMAQAASRAKTIGLPIMDHALDLAIAGRGVMHEGERSAELDLPGIPSLAEVEIVRRDMILAVRTGCRIHIQHVSCAESVDLIRQAKKAGVPVSGEATPHHLALTDLDVTGDNANLKMNPPLRTEIDRESIYAAVADGTLGVLATDHAPHLEEEKAKDFVSAPFGVVGLETAVGVTFTLLVKAGTMSVKDWLSRWTIGPAKVLGIRPPSLAVGEPADLTILDLDSEWIVRSRTFLSKSRNTPFEGRKLVGRSVLTLHRGTLTWQET
jgi:dihydroorotase